jgi:hypothetical protein
LEHYNMAGSEAEMEIERRRLQKKKVVC